MANRHRRAIERTYRRDFESMHNANALNRPSINMVCYDKLHVLYTHPMCDSHVLPNTVVVLPGFVPLRLLLSLAWHLNILVD